MKVKVPLGTNPNGFYIIIGISIILALVGGIFVYTYTSKASSVDIEPKKNKKRKSKK